MSRLTKYMPAVLGYREKLATLQGAWDTLALLSHLSGDGTNLADTRQAFESLAADLVTHLEAQTHRKALLAARARAQVAIDILVRNLFERTADIGFLASDTALERYAREVPELRERARAAGPEAQGAAKALEGATRSMQHRLAEYVSKYSVYHNVILLSPNGEVLAQLAGGTAPGSTKDPLLGETLAASGPYVETFRESDLVPGSRRALIYSHRVTADRQTLGVLCLCFRLEDECSGIFHKLRTESDWTVLCLLDSKSDVIASSDTYQLPAGAHLETSIATTMATANGDCVETVRFAGREFLAATCTAQPYQGYAGPSWRGHVLVPLDRAFEAVDDASESRTDTTLLADLRTTATKFSAALRDIPRQADAVQRDLNRSVWNGSIRQSLGGDGKEAFSKALLHEISHMGRKTQEVFERSIEQLHETVVSSVLHDSQFRASLAVELLARNLYERANDCRWWALDATLIGRLGGIAGYDDAAATQVLQRINALYTVYYSIALLDSQCRIVCTSRADDDALVGSVVDEPWAARVLALTASQAYDVSKFQPTALYQGRPTLLYSAPVRSAEGRVIGAIAVVFDTAPQLAAMLNDVLPKDEAGTPLPDCGAVFLDRDLQVMSCTEPALADIKMDMDWSKDRHRVGDARIARLNGSYHAVGAYRDTGYREYPGLGGYAVVLMSIGKIPVRSASRRLSLPRRAASRQEKSGRALLAFATFAVGETWYALPAGHIVEAVNAAAIQSLPIGQRWCAGYLLFRGDAIDVVDGALLLATANISKPETVVVVRPPGSERPFGLLVETLGDVPEILEERLLPIGRVTHEPADLLAQYAIEGETANDPIVIVLSTERLLALLQGHALAA